MKNFLITTLFIFATICSVSAQRQTITKFEGQPITGISVNGAFDVQISQGEKTYATVDIPDDLASKLTFELNVDGVLRVAFGSAAGSIFVSSKNRPMLTVVMSRLDYLYVSGASTIIGKGKFTSSGTFTATLSGTAFVSFINIDCVQANITASEGVQAEDLTIQASEKFMADISGPSKVTFNGSAPFSKVVSSGTASVDMLGFQCDVQEAITTGTSLIRANVTGTADVTVGGISSFKYSGDGKVKGEKAKKI